jgi:hypothetical protein
MESKYSIMRNRKKQAMIVDKISSSILGNDNSKSSREKFNTLKPSNGNPHDNEKTGGSISRVKSVTINFDKSQREIEKTSSPYKLIIDK